MFTRIASVLLLVVAVTLLLFCSEMAVIGIAHTIQEPSFTSAMLATFFGVTTVTLADVLAYRVMR